MLRLERSASNDRDTEKGNEAQRVRAFVISSSRSSAMALIPGYPILMGAFIHRLRDFQTFQRCRENNDIVYSALLPVAKRDVVRENTPFPS